MLESLLGHSQPHTHCAQGRAHGMFLSTDSDALVISYSFLGAGAGFFNCFVPAVRTLSSRQCLLHTKHIFVLVLGLADGME